MAQRITRAKKKIAAAKVPYRVPETADLPVRLGGVLAVLFLAFNEGYLATGDGDPLRAELTGEAIRLTRVLRQLLPEEPEVAGLLPVVPGRLHHRAGHALLDQMLTQGQDLVGHRPPGRDRLHVLRRPPPATRTHTLASFFEMSNPAHRA
jgi:hypothetical protein